MSGESAHVDSSVVANSPEPSATKASVISHDRKMQSPMAQEEADEEAEAGGGPAEAGGGPAFFKLYEDDATSEAQDDLDAVAASSTPSVDLAPPVKSFRSNLLWLLGGVALTLAVAGSLWSIRAGDREEIQKLEAKIQRIEAQTVQQKAASSQVRLAAEIPPTSQSAGTSDDAGSAAAATSDVLGGQQQCIAGAAVDADSGMLRLKQCSGEEVSVPLQSTTPGPRSPSGSETLVSDKDEKKENDGLPDLACARTPHKEWREFKALLIQWLGGWSGGTEPSNQEQVRSVLELVQQTLRPVYHEVNECGMGRLSMTLLALIVGEGKGSLLSVPSLHSPLLTILLDIPWGVLMRSGWPFFGLLSQLQLHTHRLDDAPSDGHIGSYFIGLVKTLPLQDVDTLVSLGAQFIYLDDEASKAREAAAAADGSDGAAAALENGHVMPTLCAWASLLLNAEVLRDKDRAEGALQHMQAFYRQAVMSMDDLQATVHSAWPLYGILHAASIRLNMLQK